MLSIFCVFRQNSQHLQNKAPSKPQSITLSFASLPDRKDRMSMWNALEVRVPFCDYRIAEYLYNVPWEFKEHSSHL